MEQTLIARPGQAPIEKHRHRRKHDAAERVVLMLQRRFIADAYRPVIAIAFEIGRDNLVETFGWHDAVDRPQRILGRDAEDEGDETLHCFRRAETIEGFADEIAISTTARAGIP